MRIIDYESFIREALWEEIDVSKLPYDSSIRAQDRISEDRALGIEPDFTDIGTHLGEPNHGGISVGDEDINAYFMEGVKKVREREEMLDRTRDYRIAERKKKIAKAIEEDERMRGYKFTELFETVSNHDYYLSN